MAMGQVSLTPLREKFGEKVLSPCSDDGKTDEVTPERSPAPGGQQRSPRPRGHLPARRLRQATARPQPRWPPASTP